MSTNTHVSWSPIALCTSAAATAESTPPDSPQITRSPPTWARTSSTPSSMIEVCVHVGRAAADVEQERPQHVLAPLGVHHLRVELHAVDATRSRSSSAAIGAPGVDAVTVNPAGAVVIASPWLIHTICSADDGSSTSDDRVGAAHHRAAVLAAARARHLAAELLRDELGAVADAQDREAGVVDRGVDRRRVVDVHRRGTAREDDAQGRFASISSSGIVRGTISE